MAMATMVLTATTPKINNNSFEGIRDQVPNSFLKAHTPIFRRSLFVWILLLAKALVSQTKRF